MPILYIRVTKILGAPIFPRIAMKAVHVCFLSHNSDEEHSVCRITDVIESEKVWELEMVQSQIQQPQTVVVRLLDIDIEPQEIEIARMTLSTTWFPADTYVSEYFPLKPMVPCVSTPIALLDIQLSSDVSVKPSSSFEYFNCPRGYMTVRPKWRPLEPYIPLSKQSQEEEEQLPTVTINISCQSSSSSMSSGYTPNLSSNSSSTMNPKKLRIIDDFGNNNNSNFGRNLDDDFNFKQSRLKQQKSLESKLSIAHLTKNLSLSNKSGINSRQNQMELPSLSANVESKDARAHGTTTPIRGIGKKRSSSNAPSPDDLNCNGAGFDVIPDFSMKNEDLNPHVVAFSKYAFSQDLLRSKCFNPNCANGGEGGGKEREKGTAATRHRRLKGKKAGGESAKTGGGKKKQSPKTSNQKKSMK